jgi:hypothetical protein
MSSDLYQIGLELSIIAVIVVVCGLMFYLYIR